MNIEQDYRVMIEDNYGIFRVSLFLSNTVNFQKRSVYNFLMMFGDVGGLHDFITLVLSALLVPLSEKI